MNLASQSMLNMFRGKDDVGYSWTNDVWLAHRLKRYLDNGADIHATQSKETRYPENRFNEYQVIHYAAHYGLRHVYQVAKNAGADLEAKTTFLNETPFQIISWRILSNYKLFSSQKNYESLALKMIEDGVMTDIADSAGYTPLLRTESPILTQALINMKVDINAYNKDGDNALHKAVQTYKAFCSASNSSEEHERYLFIQKQALKKAELLINAGIDKQQKNKNGETPFDLIKNDYWHDYSNTQMYQLLEEANNLSPKKITNTPPRRAVRSRILDWQRD